MVRSGIDRTRDFRYIYSVKGFEKEEYTASADREWVTEESGLEDPGIGEVEGSF